MEGLRITRAARRDLVEIGRYTRDRWGLAQARRYLTDLDDRFGLLARKPQSGRRCDDIRAGYWRAQQGKHVIFYRLTKTGTVEIIRILHERMLPELHL